MLEKGGCQDVAIDFATKTATCTVPATVKDEDIAKAVNGRFKAKVAN